MELVKFSEEVLQNKDYEYNWKKSLINVIRVSVIMFMFILQGFELKNVDVIKWINVYCVG